MPDVVLGLLGSDFFWGLLGVLVAAVAIPAFLGVAGWLEKREREAALARLREALCMPDSQVEHAEVGALLYKALAPVATVDYEADWELRNLTAQVLEKARRSKELVN
jgi:hypothetical protein